MTQVLIIGSSHVNRLQNYVRSQPACRNFNFVHDPVVHFRGISGGRISDGSHCRQWEHAIENVRPEHLIVHVGGNDLDSCVFYESEAELNDLVLRLVLMSHTFQRRYSISSVTILQLMPRTKTHNLPVLHYNNTVHRFNILLRETLSSNNNLRYWKIRGIKNSPYELLCDGVHFNREGFIRYYRSIRGAIITAIRSYKH